MELIFHILGICPDNVSHFDLKDLSVNFYFCKEIFYELLFRLSFIKRKLKEYVKK